MYHIAIMKKSWKLTKKILTGRKKIESRWYKTKCAPWGRITPGDVVYFKDSGEPVSIRAEVKHVIQLTNLTQKRVRHIITKYAKDDGITKKEIPRFFKLFKNKKYCLLIFLKNPVAVKPFEIDKTGFGTMSSWICTNAINRIKRI